MSYEPYREESLRLQFNTVAQATKKLKCSERTVQKMAQDGRLEAFKDSKSKTWRISARSIEEIKNRNNKSIDEIFGNEFIEKESKVETNINPTKIETVKDVDVIDSKELEYINNKINPIVYLDSTNKVNVDEQFKRMLQAYVDVYGTPKAIILF